MPTPTVPTPTPTVRGPHRSGAAGLSRAMNAVGAAFGVLALLGVAAVAQPLLSPAPAGAQVLADLTSGNPAAQAPVLAPSRTPGPAARPAGPAPRAPLGQEAGPAAFRPARIGLPSGATAAVLGAGVHPDGSMVIPENPAEVGWWDGGALAGEPFGSVVVAGHVDSRRYGVGFMAEMARLRPGDVVVLTAGPRVQRYRVDGLTQVPKARLAADADPFRQDTTHRLVLITCAGTYDRSAHRYPDNLVATATPVG